MKALITILFLFLLPYHPVTQTIFKTQTIDKKTMDKKAREAEFRSALNDLTAKDIKKATDFQGWLNQWYAYVDNGLAPHPKHKPPF